MDLKSVIGKKIISFECSTLDEYSKTYGNLRINFDICSLEICNEQKTLPFYDDNEDIAFFYMEQKNLDDKFIPYIEDEQPMVYDVGENITGIIIVEDTVNIRSENYKIVFDMAIEIVTENNTYIFSKGWFFDEHIYFSQNKSFESIYPLEQVIDDWSDENAQEVNVKRKYINL